MRTLISPEKFLSYCRWGGCDPDIWDHLDGKTGWPLGMKLDKHGKPKAFYNHSIAISIPEYDNRVFHLRANSDDNAPWRKTSVRLLAEAGKRKARIRGIKIEDIEWDEPEAEPVDLDDPDLW
jgi:hypothetical protein